jgi:hypothetical protein
VKEPFEGGAERGPGPASGVKGKKDPESSTDCLSFLDRRRRCMLSFALWRGRGVIGSTNLGIDGGGEVCGVVVVLLLLAAKTTWARLGLGVE